MRPDRPRALVTGATGFIGRALIDALLASGQPVVAVTRLATAALPDRVDVRSADLATGEGLTPRLFHGVDQVFHCAGEIRNPAAMRALHVDGTSRLVRALAESPAAGKLHWVQLSSVGAYGPPRPPTAPREVTEQTPENPAGEYETTKTESDHLIRRAADEGVLSHSVVRPSAVIGPGMSNASLPGLIALVRRGLFVHIGPAGSLAHYVHVDDVVRALTACGLDPRARGETFNVSSDCGWAELVARIAGAAGVRAPQRRVPAALARAVARLAAPVPFIPLSPARIDILTNRTQYPADRIRSRLDFEFSRPMPGAVDEIVQRC